MAELPNVLFPLSRFPFLPYRPPASPWSWKTTRRSQTWLFLTYLCIYFCIYSIPLLLAGFPVVRCLSVRSMTIVLLLLIEIRQNNKKTVYAPDLYVPALDLMYLKIWVRFYILSVGIREAPLNPPRFSPLHPNLGAQRLLNITYRLVVFECCCGPPVQVGAGRVLPLRAEEGTQ